MKPRSFFQHQQLGFQSMMKLRYLSLCFLILSSSVTMLISPDSILLSLSILCIIKNTSSSNLNLTLGKQSRRKVQQQEQEIAWRRSRMYSSRHIWQNKYSPAENETELKLTAFLMGHKKIARVSFSTQHTQSRKGIHLTIIRSANPWIYKNKNKPG